MLAHFICQLFSFIPFFNGYYYYCYYYFTLVYFDRWSLFFSVTGTYVLFCLNSFSSYVLFHIGNVNYFDSFLFYKNNKITIIKIIYNYPPKGRWIVVDIYRDAKGRGIYPPLLTDSEGNSCFSLYQIRSINKCCFNFFFWNFGETTRYFSFRSQNSE